MYNTNIVVISGNVTADPELRQTKDGTFVARFKVAVNRGDRADFLPCTAFGKTAENIRAYVSKGSRVIVQGSLRSSTYQDKDGTNRTAYEISVSSCEFVRRPSEPAETAVPDDFGEISLDPNQLPF